MKLRPIVSITALVIGSAVASFALGKLSVELNPLLLPQDPFAMRAYTSAVDDVARHFGLGENGKRELKKGAVIAVREAGVNCIVFPTTRRGWSEWIYQVCYSDQGRLLGIKAS